MGDKCRVDVADIVVLGDHQGIGGAIGRTRRTLTAATSGALALLGALLGTGGAYLALTAGYDNDLGSLSRVPLPQLTVILAGLPLVAATAGWLLAGRQPPALALHPLE